MGYPHPAITTPASAAKYLFKTGQGNLIRAAGLVFSAGAGLLLVYDVSAAPADSAAPSPIAVTQLIQVTNSAGTFAAGSLDFKETPLKFNAGCFIALSSGPTAYSLNAGEAWPQGTTLGRAIGRATPPKSHQRGPQIGFRRSQTSSGGAARRSKSTPRYKALTKELGRSLVPPFAIPGRYQKTKRCQALVPRYHSPSASSAC